MGSALVGWWRSSSSAEGTVCRLPENRKQLCWQSDQGVPRGMMSLFRRGHRPGHWVWVSHFEGPCFPIGDGSSPTESSHLLDINEDPYHWIAPHFLATPNPSLPLLSQPLPKSLSTSLNPLRGLSFWDSLEFLWGGFSFACSKLNPTFLITGVLLVAFRGWALNIQHIMWTGSVPGNAVVTKSNRIHNCVVIQE